MKKSEAIMEISSNLWGKNIPTNSKELAELVILLSEDLGMLPPYNKNHRISNYAIAMGVSYKETYCWEPEDDK